MTPFGAPFIAAACYFALILTASCEKRRLPISKPANTTESVTLTVGLPGTVRLLTSIKPNYKWVVNFPRGLAQVFVIGTKYADNTVISVNGTKDYKLSELVNRNPGLEVSAKQITIYYAGQLLPGTDILLYLRDKGLRDPNCKDPVVITNWNAPTTPTTLSFLQPANTTADCAVTVFASTMRTNLSYTLSFPTLGAMDKTTIKAIPGVYQSPQTDDITLFSFTSSDSQKWTNQPLYQRAITFVLPSGSRFNGTVTANDQPSSYRPFKKGDLGCITSRQYPAPNYVSVVDKYTVTANTTTLFQINVVSADLGANGTIDITTVPASALSQTIRSTASNQQYKFKATSFTIKAKPEGKGERGFLIRYSEGKEEAHSLGERVTTVWWITALFALLAVKGNQ